MKIGIKNETVYDGRSVGSIVRWVARYLEIDKYACYVKVKHHNGHHAYQGRFYSGGRLHGGYVWDWRKHEWKEINVDVPHGYSHLIVCRIGKPGTYPCETHVYDRRDSPGTWVVENWQEALVSIMAHEGMHLRQHYKGKRGSRYNEVETEWAAFRLWNAWRESH